MIKKFVLNLIGKKIIDATTGKESWGVSKGKIGPIIYVIVVALQEIPKAFGHPIQIPLYVFDLLEAVGISLGVYGIRAAQPAKIDPTVTPTKK